MAVLGRRQTCYDNGFGETNCYDAWDSWVRWLVLGLIIAGAILIFLLFSCLTARRRRRMGYAPYRGTAWAVPGRYQGGAHPGNPPETYNTSQQYQQPYYNYNAPPAYGGGGAANDYYGRGQNVELQQPQQVYGAYNGQYAPPAGAPPSKR